jgi:hypothetical protein
MDKETGDDNLAASSNRLGNRFAGSSADESESNQKASDNTADASPGSQSSATGDEENEETPEYVPTTLYLPEETRRDFRRFLKRLTLDHPEIEDAQKRELHTALMRASMEHPSEIAELVEEKMQ